MIQPGPEFDSLFRYIVVVSQRAEQLINGAKLRSESRHVKPTLQALEEVDRGLVGWRILTQEELDAQRQAIVDQFRAEVGADRIQAETRPQFRDVLPTRPVELREEPVEVEVEEGDEELGRLQRLLGLGDRGRSVLGDEEELSEPDEEDISLDLEAEEEPVDEEGLEERGARGDEYLDDSEEGAYLDDSAGAGYLDDDLGTRDDTE